MKTSTHRVGLSALSCTLFQRSDEHSSPVAWATSAEQYQFEIVEPQLLCLSEGSERKSRRAMYDIQIKTPKIGGAMPLLPYKARLR